MAGKVLISLNEVGRYAVIEQVLWLTMEQSDTALWLGVSVRHVKRLHRALHEQGIAGVISKRRGVPISIAAYLESLQHYASEHGRLVVLYSDRHCIFTNHDPEDPEPIECERAIVELNIESILAYSPKARGRQSTCAASVPTTTSAPSART